MRVNFDQSLLPLRNLLLELVPVLESQPGWYGSIFFERKSSQSLSCNLKQTQVNDQLSSGVVFRIYDGFTLFEQASDDLAPSALADTARRLVARVSQSKPAAGAIRRPYVPAVWAERLVEGLESEIRDQIPADVNAKTPVHFGIRFREDPRLAAIDAQLSRLKGIVSRCRELAPSVGFGTDDVSYVVARQSFATEESIFVDRESNLSQTLFRISLTVVTMAGTDRTLVRSGGLGGLEAVDFDDAKILKLLTDLKALKDAERMVPGKYRLLIGPVLAGVLAHEAFGHSQEGDTCARGRSKAWELHHSGERVGNEHATILNNPAIFQNAGEDAAAWGSYFFDEEGWLAREQVLLDQGKLQAPMTNLTSAVRLGVPRTANGKRESWMNGVYTRQTNTYFSAGKETLSALMQKLDHGFVGTEAAGGMEDPKGMGIQVGISYLREVRDGKLTGRVLKGPAGGDIQLTGYVPEVLNSIIGKSKIEAESESPDRVKFPFNDTGGCGKYHKEFVLAGCGGTYLLLDQVTLG